MLAKMNEPTKHDENGNGTAVAYCRYSSELQDASSIQRQRELAQRYCTAQGLNLLRVFVDEAVSAFKGKNRAQELGRLVRYVEDECKPDYLLVEDVDRLSRENPLDFISNFSRLFQSGIKIVQTARGSVTDPTNGLELIMMMMGQFQANDENVKRAKRVSASYVRRCREGIRCPRVPYGYMRSSSAPSAPLKEHPEHSEVVRRIFRLFSEGQSYNRIARGLNVDRIVHPGAVKVHKGNRVFGKGWTPQSVKLIVSNDGYFTGDQRTKHGIIHRVYDPPLIDSQTAARSRRIMAALRHNREYSERMAMGRPSNLFSNLLYCAKCKEKFIITQSKSWIYRRYGCKQQVIGLCDNSFTVQVNQFEERIFQILYGFFSSGEIGRFLEEINRSRTERLSQLSCLLKDSDADIKKEQGILSGLLDRYADAPKTVRLELDHAIPDKRKRLDAMKERRDSLLLEIENETVASKALSPLHEFVEEIAEWVWERKGDRSTPKLRIDKVVTLAAVHKLTKDNVEENGKGEFLRYRLKLKSLINELVDRIQIDSDGVAIIQMLDNHLFKIAVGELSSSTS